VPEVVGDVGGQVVADGVGVPVGATEQVLDRIGVGVAGVFGQLPALFVFDLCE
jgi:hypothetical protein